MVVSEKSLADEIGECFPFELFTKRIGEEDVRFLDGNLKKNDGILCQSDSEWRLWEKIKQVEKHVDV